MSRFGPESGDALVEVQGYNVLGQVRNTGGGGELLCVRNNLKAKILYPSKTTRAGKPLKPEYLFCMVWEGNRTPTLVAVVYRPSDVSLTSGRQFLDRLSSCCSDYSHEILMCD